MPLTLKGLFFLFGFSAFLPQGLSAALLLAILCFWLVSGEQRRLHLQNFPPKAIMVLLAVFCLWPFVVVAYSGWFVDTATRLFHVLRVALIIQMGLMLTSGERLTVFKGLIWGGVFTSVVVWINSIYPLPEWAVWHHLLAVKGSQSSRAMIMLALTSGVCAAMWLKTKHKNTMSSAGWLAASLCFAIVVALFTISRNAQMVLLTIPVMIALYHYRSSRGALVAAILLGIFSLLAWHAFPFVSGRFLQAGAELQSMIESGNCETSVGVRFAMYKLAFDQFLLHPFLGTGIGSFVDYWKEFAGSHCPSVSETRQPHNDFLLFAMESGWIGLLSVVFILGWFVKKFWQQKDAYGLMGLMLCWGFFVTAMVNSPMRDAGVGFVMIFLLASCCKTKFKNS